MSGTASIQQSAATIYRIAATALVLMFVLVAAQITVFAVSPPPTTPDEWLAVYTDSPLRGFVNADGLYALTNALTFPLYVALWLRLRSTAPTVTGAAMAAATLSLAIYLPTNVSVELGTVASRASGATGDARTAALGAVEALLARSTGTAFVAYYLLGAVTLVLFGWALRATQVWGRTAATTALASGTLMLVPSTFGTVGLAASFASLLPYLWFCVIAVRRLHRDAHVPIARAALPAEPEAAASPRVATSGVSRHPRGSRPWELAKRRDR